jgi:D-sedoheptulose 7-phosphate isomerase
MAAVTEPTGFLYPFIESEERDADALLSELSTSAAAKMLESRLLTATTLERLEPDLELAGRDMATRFCRGGRLLAIGNGGSATDALSAVDLFLHPPSGRPLAALALVEDQAVLTALANDVGYELVFSRQIIAHGRAEDIAIGFSTSGGSMNVLRALEESATRGLLTLGLAGYEGGPMAASSSVHHRFVVGSDSVHRIQEAQSAVLFELWSVVQRCLGDGLGEPT